MSKLSPSFTPFHVVVIVGFNKSNVYVFVCVGVWGFYSFCDVGRSMRVCSSSKEIIIIYSTQTNKQTFSTIQPMLTVIS